MSEKEGAGRYVVENNAMDLTFETNGGRAAVADEVASRRFVQRN